jgi:hypothetical protein
MGVGTQNAYGLMFVTNDTGRMYINSSGSVGIGTTSPDSLLTVGGLSGNVTTPTSIQMDNTYRGGGATFDKLKFYLYKSGTETYGLGLGDISDMQYWAGTTSTGVHRFFTSQTERMRITVAGGMTMYGPFISMDGSGAGSFTSPPSGLSYGLFPNSGVGLGISSVSAIAIWTGGTPAERIRITSGGNVGIGTTSPNSLVEIVKSSNAGSGATFPRLSIANTLATQGDGTSTYNFADLRIAAGNAAVEVYLTATYAAGTWAPQGILNVATNHPLAFKTNNTERMRILSGGVIYSRYGQSGTTAREDITPNLVLEGQSGVSSGRSGMSLLSNGSAYGIIMFGSPNSTNTDGFIQYKNDDRSMIFGAADAARMTISSGGQVTLSNSTGIRFANGSSNLNYYEEGNWTPQLMWSNGGTYTMSGLNSGRYVRVGNLVHLQFQLQWSSFSGSSGGTLRVTGLPFAGGGTSRSAGSICANASIILNSGYTWLGLTIDPGASFIYIIENASGGGYTHTPNVNSSGIVYSLTITYSIA